MKKKFYTITIVAFLMLLLVSASILTVKAAPGITLTPITGEPDDSVEVVGTGFAPDTTVGIGVGAEKEVWDEPVTVEGEGGEPAGAYEPWFGVLANGGPIKPLSFNATSNVGGTIIPFGDEFGNGTLSSPSSLFYTAEINYTSGIFQRVSSADLSSYDLTDAHIVNYTCYELGVTPDNGINTDSSGAFTTNITVPLINNGTALITAIDELGNIASSEFDVYGSPIPEGLSFGVLVLLSSVAVIATALVLRKRSRMGKSG